MTHPASQPSQPRLRSDVVLTPDGEGAGGHIVKDPRTRRYFQIDALAGAILELLDGQRTPVDVQVALAIERGEELTLEEIHEFVDGLKEKGLIEGGGPPLPARAPDLGRQVLEALERGGFKIRRADDPPPPGVNSTRENLVEARKFDEAVEMLREGRFQAALRAFEEILAVNPENRRAGAIRQILLQAGSVRTKALSEPSQETKKSNPLYYRIPLFDPDRIFGALEPWLRFIWTKPFALLYAAAVVLAGYVAVSHRVELLERLPNLSTGGWLGALIVAGVTLTTLHEFAHGLTCKHFGGKVPELGFLLILFFMPALYVDVSDAWLFKGRARRALVGLAGPMHDLLAAAVGILVWRVLPPGPWDVALFTVVVAAAASLLMNLNPLLRLDGYYILSDLSGIANLRQGALRAFGRMIQRLRGRRPATSLSRRGAIFLSIYGGLSLIYVSVVLFLLGRFVTGASTRVAGLWGPLVIALALIILLRRPVLRLVKAIGRGFAGMTWSGAAKLALAAGACAAITAIPWPLKVQGPVQIKSREHVVVRPEVSGQLAEVLVSEGERVEAGQLVARLDRSELESELEMTRARIERAQAELELLVEGPEEEQVAQARERVKAARAEVYHLRSRHERLERLRQEGLVAADMYEQVEKELKVSEGSLRAALDSARLIEKGARPEKIESARAEVARLQAQAADILRRLAGCELRAPISGVVVTPELGQRLGQRIPEGGELMEIADLSSLRPEIHVAEREIGDVRVGQEVRFKLAAYPDRTFTGTVQEVAPAAAEDDLGQAFFRVRTTVDAEQGRVRPGMTGSAKIMCGKHALGRLWVRRALRLIDPSLL